MKALPAWGVVDARDTPFLSLMVRAALWVIPSVALLYLHYRWWMTPLYLGVTLGYFFPPFTLMLHCTSHRPLFRKERAWMNSLIPWVFGPFFGQTPGTYSAHHIGMHHPENNLWDDESSTLPYQRDHWVDFLRYFTRFMVRGLGALLAYLRRTRRHRLEKRARWGEVLFWVFVLGLAFVNPLATLTVFVAPLFIARLAMMCGNWAQHAFVDAGSPDNAYRNSITCTNTGYNDRCFNDGYHIGHHLNARLHWSEMRRDFEENLPLYRDERALVFTGLDYFVIWVLLMTRSHRTLARHVVTLEGASRSREEIIQLLRERMRPVPRPVKAAAA